MAQVQQTPRLSFNDCAALAKANGTELTYLFGGEMGIGKTTIARTLAAELGYDYAYLDMANVSLGDMSMPVVSRDLRCTEYYPNEVLSLHTGRPVVLMLDEWTKAGREAKNMTLPLVEERRLGSTKLHPDSIVIASGNLPNEGLGDTIQAHQADRFIVVEMRKPSAAEWIDWAVNNDIEPVVIAFVDQYPRVLQSYKDLAEGDEANHYIFNPRQQQVGKVVTPRSLHKASTQLKKKDALSPEALHAALGGTFGMPAANDISAFLQMNDQLTPFGAIVSNPGGASVPSSPAPRVLQVFNLLMKVDKQSLRPVLQYIKRFDEELQALFTNKLLSTPSKNTWAASHPDMPAMVQKLQGIM